MKENDQLKEALQSDLLYFIPESQLSLLNGRRISGRSLLVDKQTFPNKGTFAAVFTALQHNINLNVDDEAFTISENRKRLAITPQRIEVLWVKINSQNYGAISAYGPIYYSIFHAITDQLDFCVQIPSGRAGLYLVKHPHGLPVKDLLTIGRFDETETEYELWDEINRVGFSKVVENTRFTYLDVGPTETV